MAQNIKVGDTIRYLNASGGGVVKRIERGVAWVEGPDGFELPTPTHECVVVDSQDTFVPAYKPPVVKRQEPTAQQPAKPDKSSAPVATPATTAPAEEAEQDLSFVAPLSKGPWFDRSGGEQLQVHVAYLPVSYEHFGQSPYETYLINESNYHLLFTYSTTTSAGGYKLRSAGVLEPDMRVLVEEFDASEINDHAVSHFQFVAYKPERTYRSMAPVERQVRMDVVKLVKRHAFRENPFFDEDALVIPVLEAYDGTQQAPAEEPAPVPTPAANRRGALPQRAIERAEQATATQKAPQKAPQKPTKKSVAKPQPEAKRPETPAAPQVAPAASEQTIEKVGLEAERILPNATGMTPHEVLLFQLKNFRRELDKRLDRRGSKVIFIHGAGQGVLHQLIINRIEQDYPMVQYRDVTFDGFPMGAIEVTISAK
ncbi:MAG: DUF2027 domain-containing protein [Porphyromonas sp.]|uniref:DUF2027 domain-containing protein n=2 Tax=Porphyromonas sp. TaxID=1924944 RepID=UPI002A75FB2D|nr:DUF2027 domain-containing protein [Porphyromonas sp.]MDD6928742.1 DUF2027 domain-containing protein [Bacteroidales bacterium]MDY3112410.1 DUF2027 domain-containing protein [Porphyromonas sp.]